MTADVLIGFLGGTLGTLIINSVIDFFNKKNEFKRELFRLTYERKLDKAEKAIAFHYSYLGKVMQMKNGLEVVSEAVNHLKGTDSSTSPMDIDIISGILTNVGASITELSSAAERDMYAINLYFDLDDNPFSEVTLRAYLQGLSKAKAIDDEFASWDALSRNYLANNDQVNVDYCLNKAIALIPAYLEALNGVVKSLENDSLNSQQLITNIKKQVKTY